MKLRKYQLVWLKNFETSILLKKPLDYFDLDAKRIDKLYRLGLIERTKGIGYGVYKLSESGENEIKKYNKLIFINETKNK